jgi:hypothetical protein
MSREIPEGVKILDSEPVEVKNPYTGAAVTLQPDAVAVYDWVKGSELFKDYDSVRIGLDGLRLMSLTLIWCC